MPDRRHIAILCVGAAGAVAAIALMELLSASEAYPLFAVPFATSIVAVMGSPTAVVAQPRALIGGHLVCTLVGLVVLQLAGSSPWVAALAVGVSIVAMHVTGTFHPPAGIDPLIVVLNNMPWTYLVTPVGAGALILTAFAFGWHNLFRPGSWPVRWL